ncbi:MAG: glutamine amidotransferase [Deltaproteobacteria bacterium]|nr:glutamine amidotransferase [Deltaproteobacteria bacterium]
MKPVLIIKLGDTLPDLAERRGNFEDWFIEPLQSASLDTHVVDPRRGETLPPPSTYGGILLTGSHSMVTDKKEWSLQTAAWLPGAVRSGVPLLGVCYGHQLLAAALGGTVGNHPRGIEMGTVEIQLKPAAKNDGLLETLPETMLVHASHSQTVLTLPPDAVLLASNDWDPHHAFAIGDCTWGIQFHPEFDAEIMAAYIKAFSEYLKAEGQDPDRLLKQVKETSHSRQVLERFAEIVVETSSHDNLS